jgi:hypothetical protein
MRSLRDCRPTCRRACHAAARNWAFDAVADRILTIAEIRNGAPATRALHRTEPRVSPLPDAGLRDHALGYSLKRFIVEAPRSTIGDLSSWLHPETIVELWSGSAPFVAATLDANRRLHSLRGHWQFPYPDA